MTWPRAVCAMVMLDGFGETVTVGVMSVGAGDTFTDPVPEALLKTEVSDDVYAAASVSVPVASEPAGITICTLPPTRVTAPELYVPLESVTVPVGVPLVALTLTVTVSACPAAMLGVAGVTVTTGVVFCGGGVDVEPPPHPAIHNPADIRHKA